MADGNQSSFFVPSYLLNQIPEQERQSVIGDAQKAFFLNLFGPSGGPGAAYQASQNVGLGYLQAQEAARKAQQARQAQEAQQFAAGLINPPSNISGPMALGAADLGRTGPTQTRANMVGAPNPAAAVPVEQRYRQAALGVGSFAPEYGAQLAGIAEKAGPRYQYQDGLLVDMNAPRQKMIPKLEPGETFLFDANGNIAGVRNFEGKIQAVSERARASESAKAEFAVEKITGADGREYTVPRSAITGTFDGRRGTGGGVPGVGGGTPSAAGATAAGRPGGMMSGLSPGEIEAQKLRSKVAVDNILIPAQEAHNSAQSSNRTLKNLSRLVEATDLNKITSNETVQSIGGYFKAMGLLTDAAAANITNLASMNGFVSSSVLAQQIEQKGPQTEADARRITETLRGMGDKEATLFLTRWAAAVNDEKIAKFRFLSAAYAKKEDLIEAQEKWFNRPESKESILRHPDLKRYAKVVQLDGKLYRVFDDGGPAELIR